MKTPTNMALEISEHHENFRNDEVSLPDLLHFGFDLTLQAI
jgi:hypothetical protein